LNKPEEALELQRKGEKKGKEKNKAICGVVGKPMPAQAISRSTEDPRDIATAEGGKKKRREGKRRKGVASHQLDVLNEAWQAVA